MNAAEECPSDEEIIDAAAEAFEQQYDAEEVAANELTRLAEADGLVDFDDVPGPDRLAEGVMG